MSVRDSIARKIQKLLHLRKSDNEHELSGYRSAEDWRRVMSHGRNGSGDISSVLGKGIGSGRRAQTR